jgi:(p)ppGpp synthase/HD superfamily hydrolase
MTEKVRKALGFCIFCHDNVNQKRKYTGEPYWVHPIEVMSIVEAVGGTEDMLCAALLHDTVEDTTATLEQIKEKFGDEVAALVEMLTDVAVHKPPLLGEPEIPNPKGAREERRKLNLEHTAKSSPDAQTIKLADLISNSKNIALHDPDFAEVYMVEKLKLMKVLTFGNTELYNQAKEILTEYFDHEETNRFYKEVAKNRREVMAVVKKEITYVKFPY